LKIEEEEKEGKMAKHMQKWQISRGKRSLRSKYGHIGDREKYHFWRKRGVVYVFRTICRTVHVVTLAGDAETEESKRAGDTLQDHDQRYDQRLQPVSGTHSDTGT
jgi:hypothetical protein